MSGLPLCPCFLLDPGTAWLSPTGEPSRFFDFDCQQEIEPTDRCCFPLSPVYGLAPSSSTRHALHPTPRVIRPALHRLPGPLGSSDSGSHQWARSGGGSPRAGALAHPADGQRRALAGRGASGRGAVTLQPACRHTPGKCSSLCVFVPAGRQSRASRSSGTHRLPGRADPVVSALRCGINGERARD
jgi:hypothetical protein